MLPRQAIGPDPDPGEIDPMSLSCSDLKDLLKIVNNLIGVLQSNLDDTGKLRFLQRRKIQLSINSQLDLRLGITNAMEAKKC